MAGFAVTSTIAVTLAILILPFITQSMPSTWSNVEKRIQFNYVGSADGKSFFVENALNWTWLEASKLCKNSSMRLASITSVAQQDVLKSIPLSYGGYWTGGRDSRTHSQFAWQFNEVTVNSTMAGPISYFNSIQTCLYFELAPSYKNLRAVSCASKLGVLCEIST